MADTKRKKEQEPVPFDLNLLRFELYTTIILVVIVFVVGILGQMHPVGLGEPADPFNTPAHIKPEWYFLGLYQVLKFIPKTIGVLLPILSMLLVILWPFIDRQPDASHRARWTRLGLAVVFLLVIVVFTVWGALS